MIKRIMIPLYKDEVAPRFDLATEVMIAIISTGNTIEEQKIIVLPRSSPEDLCHQMLSQNISTLICGAIEDEYYQFLKLFLMLLLFLLKQHHLHHVRKCR